MVMEEILQDSQDYHSYYAWEFHCCKVGDLRLTFYSVVSWDCSD